MGVPLARPSLVRRRRTSPDPLDSLPRDGSNFTNMKNNRKERESSIDDITSYDVPSLLTSSTSRHFGDTSVPPNNTRNKAAMFQGLQPVASGSSLSKPQPSGKLSKQAVLDFQRHGHSEKSAIASKMKPKVRHMSLE